MYSDGILTNLIISDPSFKNASVILAWPALRLVEGAGGSARGMRFRPE